MVWGPGILGQLHSQLKNSGNGKIWKTLALEKWLWAIGADPPKSTRRTVSPPPPPTPEIHRKGTPLHDCRKFPPLDLFLGLPSRSDSKESAYNLGDLGLIPGWGRSSGEGNGNPLQYSCLENSMDRGVWWATVCGFAKRKTGLSN